MQSNGTKIAKLVAENKMLDAKKEFQHAMDVKMAQIVTKMREEVAKSVFSKK